MNKLFTKIAALALGATMAVGVGVAVASGNEAKTAEATTAGTAYTISSTAATTITNNGLYVLKQGTNGFTGSIASNWAQTTTTASNYFILKAVGSSTSFTLQDMDDSTKQIYCSAAKKIAWGSTGTTFKFMTGKKTTSISNAVGNSTVGTLQYNSSGGFRPYTSATGADAQLFAATPASTKLTGIALSGTGVDTSSAPAYSIEFNASDSTAHTINVGLTPSNATDQKVNITSTGGTSGLVTRSTSQVTCSSGSGSFTVTSKGDAGYEVLTLKGNTETSVQAYLTVTVLDDSKTYYSVSYTGLHGNLSNTSSVVEGDPLDTYLVPDTHYHLPTSITLTMGGSTLTPGTDYDYDNETGRIQILEVTGDVVVSTSCVEDSKYTITYVHGDHGTGDDYVVNNVYAGSYTLATFATAGFTASSGYSFKKWSVGGVEYAEGASVTISGATTVTAVYQEVTTYTIVTDVSKLADGTKFVLVGYASSTYRIDKDLNSGHIKMNAVTAATTISNGTSSGSTLVTTEADIYTLKGSAGAWEIVDASGNYLQFTGTSNGNDSFTDSSSADTKFSISLTDGKVIIASNSRSSRYLYYNTSTGDLRNYGGTSSSVIACYMFAYIPPQNELSSIALSGDYKTSFASGDTFSFGGTVTASYTIASDANVTSSTTFHLDSSSGTNMSGVTMTHAAHDGHTIYAKYTEGGITKTASYSITVSNAPVSSVSIETHAAEVGLEEDYSISGITPTVLPADAVKTTEWVVSANTVSDDYTWNGTTLTSGQTEGTITLRCRSTADNSKYDELVVTVTGDPTAEFIPASVSGYVGKGASVAFTYGNIDDTSKIAVSSSNASVTVGAITASAGEGSVAITFVSAGSATLSISYDGGSTLDSITVTVSDDSVTALTWSAPTIKVYSGASTTVSDASSWNVHYTMASGDYGSLLYGEYTLKLGGSTITLPHTWDATDDGKVLSIEYAGYTSPTTSTVDVTQTLQAVNASDISAWDYTFTAKAWSAAGSATLDDKEWTMSGTDDGTQYFGYDATKGQQFGSGSHPYSDLTLSSSAFSGTIASVTVYTSGAKDIDATIQVSVGGTTYGDAQTITATNTPYTFDLGGKSGTISIDYVNSSSKAIYIKEIVVNTVSGSHNIANASGHEAAQKAVVKFAKTFNAAMDTTAGCTTNMSSAWSTATTAWNTFTSEAAALGSTEEAYAKNLIKYATAQWTENTDSDYSYCLERAMATYEKCVSSYEMTAFMSTVRPVGRSVNINPISIIGSKSDFNVISIVVITSVISLTAIGGYFFLRKRKENI